MRYEMFENAPDWAHFYFADETGEHWSEYKPQLLAYVKSTMTERWFVSFGQRLRLSDQPSLLAFRARISLREYYAYCARHIGRPLTKVPGDGDKA
jgi:hypothetical protein